MLFLTVLVLLMEVCVVSAFSPSAHNTATTLSTSTSALFEQREEEQGVNRRIACIQGGSRLAIAAFGVLCGNTMGAAPAFALNTIPADNEIVKEQRTVVNQLDINNAPVADYMKFPGLYPTIGGKIATNGPYASFKDVYKLDILTKAEKAKIKEYASQLTATESTGLDVMRGRDPYRRRFNE